MKINALKRSLGLVLVSLGLSVTTTRATTIFTNQAAFLAATQPGFYLETFNSLPLGTIPPTLASPLNFSKNGFSYSASTASGQDFFNIGPTGDVWLSTFHEFDPIVFNVTSNNVTAIGGFFFLTDINGNISNGTVTVTLNNGSMFSINNASSTSFIGFTTSLPIQSLTVTPPSSGPSLIFATVNDFITGAAVPETGTSALLLGLAILSLLGAGGVCRWGRQPS
jgi:hypothetical protein